MNDQLFAVTVAVSRPDGSVERVRVGTATREGEGFSLQLGELAIEGTPVRHTESAPRRSAPASSSGGSEGGAVFPPYGRSKGGPISGATMQDLEYYASGCRRTLSDPGKARWHEKEKGLLATIEAEIQRQQGGVADRQFDEPPPLGDEDAPF